MPDFPAGARLMLSLEAHQHALPCPACQGSGVTGARYEMPSGPYVLVVDVICPACGGCGNGGFGHPGCKPEWHAGGDDDEDPWGPVDDGSDEDGPACYSCGSGRGWWPAQGFTGEGDDAVMHILRMPCGCSQGRLVEVPDATD